MHIRKKLLLLVGLLGFALLINLLAVGFLARTVAIALQTIETVGIQQQLVAVQMQARLRDSEAALYRYLLEGEPGFETQFNTQLQNFHTDVTTYKTQISSADEKNWAASLLTTYQQAQVIGASLIQLRDEQTDSLSRLETTQETLDTLLTREVSAVRPADIAYQEAVNGMKDNLREISLMVTAYLSSPEEVDPVRFTEAEIGFRQYYDAFNDLADTPEEIAWGSKINDLFAEVESLGLLLISNRNQQQNQLANFSAILFRAGEKILVGQIQPHAAKNLATARQELQRVLGVAVTTSLVVGVFAAVVAGIVTLPLLRQINAGILALLSGAGRIAKGDLTQSVVLKGHDELSELAEAFNAMMVDLATREYHLKARLTELDALRRVGLQLTSTLDPGQVLDTIAASALQLVRATEVHIFIVDDTAQNLEFATSAWQDKNIKRKPRPPRADGITAAALQTGAPQVINHANTHPLFNTLEARQWGINAIASFPLKRGTQVLGLFNVSLHDRYLFTEDDLRILGLLSDQAAIALENSRLYRKVAMRERRLQTLAQKMAQIQEEERRLIGLDLHDGLTQLLLSANMHLDTCASLAQGLQHQAKEELTKAHTRLREAITEARWVVSELRPSALEDFGLVAGLRHYATEVSEMEGWQLEFITDLGGVKLSQAAETAIFRIVQEALTNTRKYANSKRVRIVLKTNAANLILVVQDWGLGFKVNEIEEETKQFGLVGMRERVVLFGGELVINSQLDEGTKISVRIPLYAVKESR